MKVTSLPSRALVTSVGQSIFKQLETLSRTMDLFLRCLSTLANEQASNVGRFFRRRTQGNSIGKDYSVLL